MLVLLAGALTRLAAQNGQPATTPQKLTFEGDTALWTAAIKRDKTADFEQIMTKVSAALLKSSDPLRRQQAADWKVMRIAKPLGDGNIAYVHIIHPVVAGADYTILQTLYEAYPDEQRALYGSVPWGLRAEPLARDRGHRGRPARAAVASGRGRTLTAPFPSWHS
jgi:hypothetical protein